MNKEQIYKEIKKKNFKKIKEYLDERKIEFSKILDDIYWEHRELIVLDFLKYLVKNERIKKRKIIFLEKLEGLLELGYWPKEYPDQFKDAVECLRQILKLDPKNLEIKKYFLEDYFHPDLSEYITKKEIKKIAEDVLKKEPKNKKAKEVLKRLEREK